MATDTLEKYRAKRDFKITSEPSGVIAAKAGKDAPAGGKFVIHKHDATRLHYDLRLEHDGVLWSWAVTRGPSLDPHEKRLAVHVEDHPLDYGNFEGNIPKGEYGAGAVIVWDQGEWIPEYDPAFGMKKGHISFELKGSKLNGAWHLVRLKPRGKETRDNWLLIKVEDNFASTTGDILVDEPASVTSGRTIEDVAEGKPAGKPKAKNATGKKPAREAKSPGKAAAGTPETLPDFVPPALATLKPQPPAGGAWLHEVKFDGYRIQAHVAQGQVRLLTRTGLDWTPKFGSAIGEAFKALDCETAIIDGEVAVLSDKGIASFSALQAALSAKATDWMIFFAFDLLFADGVDLRSEPLVERKHRLAALIGEDAGETPLRYSEHFVEPGKTMLRHACRMGLEGVVSKLADAPYRSGRTPDWIKSKCTNRQEFVIVGYVPSTAPGRGLRSLLVGYHEGKELRYGGRVGTGFTQSSANDLKVKLDKVVTKTSPFKPVPAGQKGVVWVKPQLVAEVEFRAWTDDGILRHASFQGVREDKPAEEVVAELAAPETSGKTEKRDITPAKTGRNPVSRPTSVTLSHPKKLLWPDAGISKQGLLDYYSLVWPRMESYVVGRPLSLVRAPDGVNAPQRFFQKHASKGMNTAIAIIKDPDDGEDILYIKDFDGLAALVQMGTVEIHVWGSTIEDLDRPDMITFDLDPDEGLGNDAVIAATRDVRARLDELGLPSFLKTSGGKGYHIVVPLKPKADWAQVKTFAHDFARAMAEQSPELYTATLSKKSRGGKIFIDYLRNGRGSTAVAAYSARAKPAATVSMPVQWTALDEDVRPDHFTMVNDATPKALRGADPWKDFDTARKTLKSGGR